MEGIDNNYINEAILSLHNSIGLKAEAPVNKLLGMVNSSNISECVEAIAKYLGLPIKIDLSYVEKGYREDGGTNFESRDLVKTNSEGRGTSGITAQVYIPQDMPMFGTAGLNGYHIKVKISENCVENPQTFIAVMAHELSHIVLNCLRHKEKENEIYTDLTAMMLGFISIMKHGRKVENVTSDGYTQTTRTTTYGYFSDEQFDFAYAEIMRLLNSFRSQQSKIRRLCGKCKNIYNKTYSKIGKFKYYFECMDNYENKKMPQKDGKKISSFFQPNYLSDFEAKMNECKEKIIDTSFYIEQLCHYFPGCFQEMDTCNGTLADVHKKLEAAHKLIKENIRIVGRCVSLKLKLQYGFKKSFLPKNNFNPISLLSLGVKRVKSIISKLYK